MSTISELLDANITDAQKDLFQRAAALRGQTVEGFVIESITERASQMVEGHDVIELNKEDSLLLAESLINPPEPNEYLQNAAKLHKEVLGKPADLT